MPMIRGEPSVPWCTFGPTLRRKPYPLRLGSMVKLCFRQTPYALHHKPYAIRLTSYALRLRSYLTP